LEKEASEVQNKEDFSELIDKLARMIVKRRLSVVAIVMLESTKPLTFLGSQLMVFLDPFISVFFKPDDYRKFYKMIEDRRNVDRLIERIEYYENLE